MTCMNCGTMYPANYEKCPKCKAIEAKRTQYKTNKNNSHEDFEEPMGNLVIGSELSQGDADYQY